MNGKELVGALTVGLNLTCATNIGGNRLINISNAKQIEIQGNILNICGETSSIVLKLEAIDHIKLEKKFEAHKRLTRHVNIIFLYNSSHQILHRLLFEESELSLSVFKSLGLIIKESGRSNG